MRWYLLCYSVTHNSPSVCANVNVAFVIVVVAVAVAAAAVAVVVVESRVIYTPGLFSPVWSKQQWFQWVNSLPFSLSLSYSLTHFHAPTLSHSLLIVTFSFLPWTVLFSYLLNFLTRHILCKSVNLGFICRVFTWTMNTYTAETLIMYEFHNKTIREDFNGDFTKQSFAGTGI